jgi:hypothetical protein
MKGIDIVPFPNIWGHNEKNILILNVIDFDNYCYYKYDATNNGDLNLKLIETKVSYEEDNIYYGSFDYISEEIFLKLLDTKLIIFKQYYINNLLKLFNLHELII